jgi:hypothetical protein
VDGMLMLVLVLAGVSAYENCNVVAAMDWKKFIVVVGTALAVKSEPPGISPATTCPAFIILSIVWDITNSTFSQ